MTKDKDFFDISNESDIYNVVAKFLIELIENEYDINNFLETERRKNIDFYSKKFEEASSIQDYDDKIKFLDKFYKDVKNKDLFNKLCFLIAFDLKQKNSSMYITSYNHIVLNEFYTDKIEIYPIFERRIRHLKTYNISLSSLFQNLSYFYKPGIKLKVKNIYFPKNIIEENNSIFKVGFMPFSSNYHLKFSKNQKDGKTILTPIIENNYFTNEQREYFLSELSYLINQKVDLIICPETLPDLLISDGLIEEVNNLVNKANTILFGPSTYIKINEEQFTNRAILLNRTLGENVIIEKVFPYREQADIFNPRGYENIVIGNTITVIHIENFGSILLLICSDFFQPDIGKIIKMLNIDAVAIASATSSYNLFDNEHANVLSENRLLFQCNLCSLCFKNDNKKMKIPPINFYSNNVTNDMKKHFMCLNNKCNYCKKHFIIKVKINDEFKGIIEVGEENE